MLINFKSGHSTVIGITRSGKTYATMESLKAVKEGVLFFNTQLEDLSSNFIKVTANDNIKILINALNNGKKINYSPSLDSRIREKELKYIIDNLYIRSKLDKKIYLVVDEVHLYEKESLKSLIQVATTGLRYNIFGVWISQRPANIDNTLMTQSNQFILFKTNMEGEYFKRYGIPADKIKDLLEKGGKFSYCTYDFIEVYGPYKV